MANEYLKRTPTSTGNRRVFTWSSWIKRGKLGTNHNIFCSTEPALISKLLFDGNNKLIYQNNSPSFELTSTQTFRDVGSWMHILFVANTTASIESERIQIFVNGTRLTSFSSATYPAVNTQLIFNYGIGHWISSESSNVNYFEGEFTDIFFVDGQALTPDVFGFNKPGKGYISAGSTIATDFRAGQWVPKTPRIIKAEINRRGGFGVNGFYLPMNDGNNFGADFHCTPNSIIKLQENLPQPKCRIDGVGDYTGALREDPFKQYLLFAQPNALGGLQNGYGDYSHIIRGLGSPKVITGGASGTPTISTTQSLYYGSSLYFDGNDTINVETSDSNYLGRDFTIEFWVWHDSAYPINQMAFNTVPHTSFGISLNRGGSGQTALYVGNGSSWQLTDFRSGGRLYSQQWNHVAVERYNNAITIYHNGVAQASYKQGDQVVTNSGTFTGVMPTGFSSSLRYGTYENTTGEPVLGYIQDYRIYSGVAKYKGGFDVPRPYTPVGIATWRAVPDTTANNFATFNPLIGAALPAAGNSSTLVNGNLTKSQVNASRTSSTVATPKTGKWYAEFHASGSGSNFPYTGVALSNSEPAIIGGQSNAFQAVNTNSFTGLNYHLFNSATTQAETNPPGLGDILGVALDVDNGIVYYYKNGILLRTDNTLIKAENYVFLVQTTNDGVNGTSWYTSNANFGQNPTFSGNTTAGTFTDSNGKGLFKYQPPSGFLALCEDNLPKPAIEDPGKYFKTVLYTGDGNNGRSIDGVGFKPDLVWIKSRTNTRDHRLMDTVRGINNVLQSNLTNVEFSPGSILSVNTDGFSLTSTDNQNVSGEPYVAWCWKAGGEAVTNTNGSITSVVSVNQAAGFSIVSFTMNPTAGTYTVGHGLGKIPKFIITKQRTQPYGWWTQHGSLGSSKYLALNETSAAANLSWGGDPTSSTFTINNSFAIAGTPIIAYCWAEIEGYSKFGSYVGNGSADGPFVYCGFKPAWVMVKNTSVSGNWLLWDNARTSINPNNNYLIPNSTLIDQTSGADIDFLSNGFKIRNTSVSGNGSGNTIIFAAFAESPFQTANSK